MKQITEIGDCYPTYEQCVELEKYRQRATFIHIVGATQFGRTISRLSIEYGGEPSLALKTSGNSSWIGCPSVPELEQELDELSLKIEVYPPPIVRSDKDFRLLYDLHDYRKLVLKSLGETMAQAYAALLLKLYAKLEPIKPE